MSKHKKSKKVNKSPLANAGKVASRNRRTLGLAGAGLAAAAALFLGRRYRDQRDAARLSDDGSAGAAI